MEIKAGKYYKTRDGHKVGPMIREADGDFMANHPDGRGTVSWKPDGVRYKGREPEADLIAEWVDEPKLWKDMTPEEKGALLLAYHEGKTIEGFWDGCWQECDQVHKFAFAINVPYRVKPEPVVETVTMYTGTPISHWGWTADSCSTDRTHRITFDLIDGKPDCNSVKMESL